MTNLARLCFRRTKYNPARTYAECSFAEYLFRINKNDSLYKNQIGSLAGLEYQAQFVLQALWIKSDYLGLPRRRGAIDIVICYEPPIRAVRIIKVYYIDLKRSIPSGSAELENDALAVGRPGGVFTFVSIRDRALVGAVVIHKPEFVRIVAINAVKYLASIRRIIRNASLCQLLLIFPVRAHRVNVIFSRLIG